MAFVRGFIFQAPQDIFTERKYFEADDFVRRVHAFKRVRTSKLRTDEKDRKKDEEGQTDREKETVAKMEIRQRKKNIV
jgi:hypothetical protein